jgi:hypothetical protein
MYERNRRRKSHENMESDKRQKVRGEEIAI